MCDITVERLTFSGGLLIIAHVVNPYGMSWRRRWNENNVDLNRNFLLDNSHCDESSIIHIVMKVIVMPPTPSSKTSFILADDNLECVIVF